MREVGEWVTGWESRVTEEVAMAVVVVGARAAAAMEEARAAAAMEEVARVEVRVEVKAQGLAERAAARLVRERRAVMAAYLARVAKTSMICPVWSSLAP